MEEPGSASHTPSIDDLLAMAVARGASDLHLKGGVPPMVRIEGVIHPLSDRPLDDAAVEAHLGAMLPDRLGVEFKERHEADFAYATGDGRRYRVNAYRQRGRVTIAARILSAPSSDFEALGLPPVVRSIITELRGLVLVTGPTGSGKSTTLAAMIDAINSTRRVNIITVEDPIEFVHEDKVGMVSQREIGVDTDGFAEAMRRVLRQDPDVILIGEMRDADTIDAALKAAETGHLVLSTLHTLDSGETINRILDFFPPEHQRQIRLLLAGSLRAILSQRLVPTVSGGRVPAVEVLINTDRIAERIADADTTHEIPEIIESGSYYGMETFDQSLLRMVAAGTVSMEEAMRHATKASDLKIKGQQLGIVPT
jgi:twitching motility protein PilT